MQKTDLIENICGRLLAGRKIELSIDGKQPPLDAQTRARRGAVVLHVQLMRNLSRL